VRPATPDRRWLLAALLFVAVARLGLYIVADESTMFFTDFDLLYYSAVNLIQGANPYYHVPDHLLYELIYPFPAVLFSLPFTILPLTFARPVFDIAVGWAFAYALWKVRGHYALLALVSGAYIYTLRAGNTTPLMVAASLLPAWGFLLLFKPNTALPLWIARPSRQAVTGGVFVLGVSLILLPSWPLDWLAALQHQSSHLRPPVLRPFGWLLLLAAIRWQTPEGRLLLASSIVPTNTLPHELVPLALVPWNPVEMGIYAAGSWIAMAVAASVQVQELGLAVTLERAWPAMLVTGYLPMLWLVLRRRAEPNHP
jgi:hypothetical protein